MKNDFEVNIPEMQEQREKLIKEKGNYASVEITVEKDNGQKCMPIIKVNLKNVGILDVAHLISSLDDTKESIIKKYPEAYLMSKFTSFNILGECKGKENK